MSYGTQIPKMPDTTSFVKSNYKMHCFICDTTIKRGQMITQVLDGPNRHYCIVLRTRSTNPRCLESPFYRPHTGARWVHKDCRGPYIWTRHTYKIQMKEDEDNQEQSMCTQS